MEQVQALGFDLEGEAWAYLEKYGTRIVAQEDYEAHQANLERRRRTEQKTKAFLYCTDQLNTKCLTT